MRPLRAVAALLVVASLGAGGASAWAVASLGAIDLQPYRDDIVAQVEARTGRTLRLEGALKLAPSWRPALLVEGMSLSNPDWAHEPELLRADRVEARVDLFALLQGALVVRRIRLEGARLALETDAEGRQSWALGGGTELEGLPELAMVSIDDGVVVWAEGGATTEVELRRLEMTGRGPARPFTLSVDLAHEGVDLRADLGLGALSDLVEPTRPYPMKGELWVGRPGEPVHVELDGAVDPRDGSLDLAVTAGAEDLRHAQVLLERADVDQPLPALGGVEASGRLTGTWDAPVVRGLQARTGRGGVALALAGETAPVRTQLAVDLRADRLDQLAPRLREAGVDLDRTLPAWGPVACTAQLATTAGPSRLEQIDCSVDDDPSLTVTGSLVPSTGRMELELRARGAQLGEVPAWLEPLELELPEPFPALGPWSLRARLSGVPDAFAARELVAESGGEAVALRVEGEVTGLPDAPVPAVTVHVSGADLGPLRPWTGELPPLPKVDARFQLVPTDEGWRAEQLEAQVGRSDLRGSVDLRAAGPRARLEAALLDLDELLGASEPAPEDARVVPLLPLEVPALPEGLVLRLQAGELIVGEEELDAVAVQVRRIGEGVAVEGGFGWEGTRFDVDAALRPDGSRTSVDLELDGHTADAGRLLAALGNEGLLTGGSMDVHVLLNGSGADTRDLLARAGGRTVVEVEQGTLASTRLNQLGGDLLDHLVKLVYPKDQQADRELHCAVLAVDFADGVARSDRGIALQTRAANLQGSAEIALTDESIDVAVHPYGRGGLGLSVGMVAKLMRFEGTLAQPHVVFDQEVVGKAAASAVAAVATSGLSLVAQGMFQRVQQDPDPCGTARQLYLGELPSAPPPSGGDTGLDDLHDPGPHALVREVLEALPDAATDTGTNQLGAARERFDELRGDVQKVLGPTPRSRTIELPDEDTGL